ncbi:MAG: osmotic-shock protein [Betaproteobacteria bacterium RIFCSPLOWO2_12_FULL_62_58]|nr:MAG: osmotic-shock protein [Betaproteobacteria bacterium RIFCSPLOWO2_02_FULL_62_79]OGA54250.1 MAG: osmotic-shock protein [Betaproteobacteria bacterium RIFCSPLOWO2_12_FULL_62_58]
MFEKALIFLANTVFGLFTIALLLRFYMQWARAAYRNPLSEFLGALTDFMVHPARRVIPGLWGLDLATLVLAWLIQVLELFVILQIKDYSLASAAGSAYAGLALLATVTIVKLGLYIVIAVVVFQAVLSWINPYTPLAPLLNNMTRPFLRIFQKLIPPIGNVDLSPLVVIVICQLLLMLPVAYLEMTLSRWL